MSLTFARGNNRQDSSPVPFQVASFDEFRQYIKADVAAAKGMQYIAGMCQVAPDDTRHAEQFPRSIGNPHRCSTCVQPRRWLGLDVDGGLSPALFEKLQALMQSYSGLIYTTASHTPGAPRCRIIIELDEALPRDLFREVSKRVRLDIDGRMGTEAIKWDPACDNPEQALYLPLIGAHFFEFNGTSVTVASHRSVVGAACAIPVIPATPTRTADMAAEIEWSAQLAQVRAAKSGARNAVINNAAFVLGRIVGAGRLDYARVETSLSHASSDWGEPKKQARKIESGLRSGMAQPRYINVPMGGSPHAEPSSTPTSLQTLSALGGLSFFSTASPSEVLLRRGDTIVPEPIKWTWDGWLAAGKMHIIGGAPGCGKTTIACKLAATVTRGDRWPDGTKAPVGDVVIWSGEDDVENVLAPRMIAMGADMSRVLFVVGMRENGQTISFDPSKDLAALERALADLDRPKLLIIDPIVSTVGGDSHKNAEVRRALQPLVDLTAKLDLVLLGITHFTKGTQGRDPVERITGSLAFAALARVVLVAAMEEAEADSSVKRLLVRAKSNLGPSSGGFEYALTYLELADHPGIIGSSVQWGAQLQGSARELLGRTEEPKKAAKVSCLEEARLWLEDYLARGQMPATDVERDGMAAGHSIATLKRAKTQLGIQPKKVGAGWTWAISRATVEQEVQAKQVDQAAQLGQAADSFPSPPLKPSTKALPPVCGPLG